jgi:hypothetical protein
MKVLIDGKEVEVQNDIKVIYDEIIFGMDDDGKDIEGELHVLLNCEGMVTDLFVDDNELVATMSRTAGELADDCI